MVNPCPLTFKDKLKLLMVMEVASIGPSNVTPTASPASISNDMGMFMDAAMSNLGHNSIPGTVTQSHHLIAQALQTCVQHWHHLNAPHRHSGPHVVCVQVYPHGTHAVTTGGVVYAEIVVLPLYPIVKLTAV